MVLHTWGQTLSQHILTPAIKSGASYITVGRPIVQAAMPEEAAREINVQIRLAANA